jgi:hypothetical protein
MKEAANEAVLLLCNPDASGVQGCWQALNIFGFDVLRFRDQFI